MIVWYEVVEPAVVRRWPGRPAGDYSDYYFEKVGRLLAHAGSAEARPACIPDEARALQSHDSWVSPPSDAVERCPSCVEAHPLP